MNLQDRDTKHAPFTTHADLLHAETRVVPCATSTFCNRLSAFAHASHHPARTAVSALRAGDVDACYMTRDLLSGFSVTQGALVGLFSFVRGRGSVLVSQACTLGARSLECYAFTELEALYQAHGFRVTARYRFDPEQAEPRFDPRLGQPEYLTMVRP